MAGSKLASSSRVRFPFQLWEMVNDEATNDIISWSEDGMSLCIHDEKRLAEEVIPRWMKTEKAAAFVRQLNGYGFRKITNLQQGSMHRGHEAEILQYCHPNFFRGGEAQVERIHLTKKNHKEKKTDSSVSVDDTAVTLANIQNRQMDIIQDLSTLKESEGRLWDEALRSQAQQQKQQRMLCVILRFLGNLQPQLEKEERQQSWAPMHAQGQRLMLEGPQTDAGDARITEVGDEEGDNATPFSPFPAFDFSQLGNFQMPSTGEEGDQAEASTNDANLISAFMDPQVAAYINNLTDPSPPLPDPSLYGSQLSNVEQDVNSTSANLDDLLSLWDAEQPDGSVSSQALETAPSLLARGEKRKLGIMGDDSTGPAHKQQKI